ncbi:MAG TPA: acetate--CoA ligase, partial [Syntrophobacteraceae bacterium]|nr:acetate--CoA ligase [Syntrophobacteraceae bacterium]
MVWKPIKKHVDSWAIRPNLLDYDEFCASFSWDEMRRELGGLPAGRGLNIAHEAIDRHCDGALGSKVAIRWLSLDGQIRDFTYEDLKAQSSRFANVLKNLGLGKGDTVCVLAGRIPELYIAAIGTFKHTSVFCPLFSAFGPEPVFQRMSMGEARVLVTTERQYRQKIAPLMERLPKLGTILLVDATNHLGDRLLSLPRLMSEAPEEYSIPPT